MQVSPVRFSGAILARSVDAHSDNFQALSTEADQEVDRLVKLLTVNGIDAEPLLHVTSEDHPDIVGGLIVTHHHIVATKEDALELSTALKSPNRAKAGRPPIVGAPDELTARELSSRDESVTRSFNKYVESLYEFIFAKAKAGMTDVPENLIAV